MDPPPTCWPGRPVGSPDDRRPALLEIRGARKRFGGLAAVSDVHLSLHDGEIVGLIGHNGAGKTTLMDLVSGFLALDGGRVLLGGMDIGPGPAHLRAVAGLGRTFQEARLFPSLTIAGTIAVALERHLESKALVAAGMRLPASLDAEVDAARKGQRLVEAMGLDAYQEKLIGELSTGTRRIVELACVLAQDPAVLLLDEPSGGVAQRETEALGPLLRRAQQMSGCAMLVIEHDMPLLRGLCDPTVALELGAVIADGAPDDVLAQPRVIDSCLGTEQVAVNRSKRPGRGVSLGRGHPGPATVGRQPRCGERYWPDGGRGPAGAGRRRPSRGAPGYPHDPRERRPRGGRRG